MQRRTVRTLLLSSALLALTLPIGAFAADGGDCLESNSPADVAAQPLDARMPATIQSLVHCYSKKHGVDPQLVAAVMKVESNYDVWAKSSKGALGLMQLIPSTGMRFGVHNFFEPAQNIEGGVKYLRFLSDKFGSSNIELITAAYNAGENLVERLGRRVPSIPETRNYVRKIQTIYKPSAAPALVSASEDVKPVVETVAPEPAPNKIYRSVDARGVIHFSNIGPPN